MIKIAWDSGHGGKDSGAVGFGVQEKDVTLKIVQLAAAKLEAQYEADSFLIRDKDVYIAPDSRDEIAEKAGANYFLSIHINSATDSAANGFESYRYLNTSKQAETIQTMIHAEVAKYVGTQGIHDRGIKKANFAVLRETSMAACLLEICFISNKTEAAKLKDPKFLDGVAQSIVNGLARAFGLARKVVTPPPAAPTTPAKTYRVQTGVFADKAKAEAQVKDLQSKGFAAVIREG